MLIHPGSPTASSRPMQASPSSACGPDQDAPATNDAFFENPLSHPLLTAEGPETGVTLGIGRCSFESRRAPTRLLRTTSASRWTRVTRWRPGFPYTFQSDATIERSGGNLDRRCPHDWDRPVGFHLPVGDEQARLCGELYDLTASPMTFPPCSPRASIIEPASGECPEDEVLGQRDLAILGDAGVSVAAPSPPQSHRSWWR